MKELDVLLLTYVERFFATADVLEQEAFVALLEMQDPELYRLLVGNALTGNGGMDGALGKIRNAFKT